MPFKQHKICKKHTNYCFSAHIIHCYGKLVHKVLKTVHKFLKKNYCFLNRNVIYKISRN